MNIKQKESVRGALIAGKYSDQGTLCFCLRENLNACQDTAELE
ncbi:hypothetical protein FOXYSP1_05791 [Fusarium oxysporum f. sp. phaseoli]|jgi:hypothetical protein